MNSRPSKDWSPAGLLQQLIRIPSVNPLGRELRPPGPQRDASIGLPTEIPADLDFGEARLTEFLAQLCDELGLLCARQAVHPLRDNLIALLPGQPAPNAGGQLLLWEAHQDTVPVDGMTIDPFGGELSGGRISGRGACDVKGSMAAMLAALARLSRQPAGPAPRPTIVLACTVNEERGFTGATALAKLLRVEGPPAGAEELSAGFFPRPPDAAIVAEPTQLDVVVAHKGVVRWKCHVRGRAAHTSDPAVGANAIHAMASVILAVEQYHREVLSSASAPHALCGSGSACVTTIRGGAAENVVPELATIGIDRRLAPGEEPQAAYRALIDYISARASVPGCRIEHDEPFMQSRGLAGDDNGPLAAALVETVRRVHTGCRTIGVAFGTDAPPISAAGVPAVVFGPGSIEQAHTADEWIAIDQLEAAAEVFYRIGREGLRLGQTA